MLTVNVCWGLGECEELCQPRFQPPLWELCEVGWKIPGCEQAACLLFPMRLAAVVLTLQPLCCAAEINPPLLRGAGKSSALLLVTD